MKDLKKIKNKLWNKTWKKCLLIFIVIFALIAVGGAYTIESLHEIVTDNHIHSITATVQDKYHDTGYSSDYYLVVIDGNKTLAIANHDDEYARSIWDSLEVGNTYRLVIKEPSPTSVDRHTYILQTNNYTS